MEALVGWFLVLILTGVIGWIGWLQWNSYRTLDQRIEQMDPTLIESAGTRIEKVLDAPEGSVVVPYVATSMVPVQNVVQVPTPVTAPMNEPEPPVRLVQERV
tara:strand:+ start:87 stop:392 length:306 start_codon:yes stop_codon:yes gene_type:complete